MGTIVLTYKVLFYCKSICLLKGLKMASDLFDDESTPVVPKYTEDSTPQVPLFHDSSQSPLARIIQLVFVIVTSLMVALTLIFSIYRAVKVTGEDGNGGVYFLLGLSLQGLVALEVIMVFFLRYGDLPADKMWFLYFVGGCIVLEAVFTDVLLFQ